MKTIEDLNKMKLMDGSPFRSAYELLIERFNDYYIGKSNGKERIKNELNVWDKEAQRYIVSILIKRIAQSMEDFDPNDLLDLLM